MADKIFGGLELLKSSLDAYTLRQKVIAGNIAHAETPGYRSRSVVFEDLLRDALGDGGQAMAKTAAGHLGNDDANLPAAIEREGSDRAADNGVNDVHLDLEMAALAETNLSHKLAARILALRYKGIRSAIRGSGQP